MLEWITGVVQTLGYSGVALLTFLENAFPPIPSEVIIPLAGFVASRGRLSVAGVIAAAGLGSLAGAVIWYELGRRIGARRVRAWVERWGRWTTLSVRDVDRSQQWFERHGGTGVCLGRLVPGVRTFVSLPAGFARMPRGPFLAYSAVGTFVWTAALTAAGVMLQANYSVVGDYLGVATNVLFIALGLGLAWRYMRCWRTVRG